MSLYKRPTTGVKRLNKLPLLIVMILFVTVLLALCYVAYQRSSAKMQIDGANNDEIKLQPATAIAEGFIKEQMKMKGDEIAAEYFLEAPKNISLLQQPHSSTSPLKQQLLIEALSAETNLLSRATTLPITGSYSEGKQSENNLAISEDQNGQSNKIAFLQQTANSYLLSSKPQSPQSAFEIKTGTVIPAVMITGINSDLPGQITAQVSQHVYDTASGNHLLIPQGSKLIGMYDSRVSYGQQRVLIAWHRIVFPDASTLTLDSMPGIDAAGYAGFTDYVNNHYLRLFGSAFMLSIISAGYQLSQPDSNSDEAQGIIGGALGLQLAQVGSELVKRNLNIQPTLEIRPGYIFNVMVNKDIVFNGPH